MSDEPLTPLQRQLLWVTGISLIFSGVFVFFAVVASTRAHMAQRAAQQVTKSPDVAPAVR